MRFDPESKALQFSSDAQLVAFHSQLTELLRIAMVEAGKDLKDPEAAIVRSKEVFEAYDCVITVLNQLRSSLKSSRKAE